MANLSSIQPVLDRFKQSAKEIYGERLVKILLYGSYARGEQHADSDIDLLLVLKDQGYEQLKMERAIFERTFSLINETGLFISPVLMPFTKYQSGKNIFLHFIRKEALELA